MEFPLKTPEYEELKTLTEPWNVIYGPIQSRRLGTSLGINLLGSGEKICGFNCPYCELGLTKLKISQMKKNAKFPTLSDLEEGLRKHIVDIFKNGGRLNFLTLAGNGEPTLHPGFSEAVRVIKKVRDELAPDTRITVLSNGTTLDSAKIIKSLNMLDDRMIKLDAGNDEMMAKINAPLVRMTVAKLIQGTKKLNDVTLQSFFIQGSIDNTSTNEVDDWIEVVGVIKPKFVHLYSLDRVPAVAGLKQVPFQRLKEIAQRLEKRTLIKGQVFSG